MKKIYAPVFLPLFALAALFASCGSSPTAPPPAPAAAANTEQHRPQFHYSPAKNWMNDPNGLVFFEGEYHLFVQHYPDSNVWGPMHWAHAVSTDMVHWEHLPIALYPDSLGYIFSGSAVVDWNNTSGFGQNGKPPLVAMFTLHNMAREKAGRMDVETQGLAYSNDRGRTWTKYAANPVISNPEKDRDFRDPKVVWHEASKRWVVTLAVGDHVEFWASPDLKNWTYLSDFGKTYGSHGGVWECPDLFPIAVDSNSWADSKSAHESPKSNSSADSKSAHESAAKWVLILNINPGHPNGGSGTQYFVGDFDGKNFTLDADFAKNVPLGTGIWLDWGKDNYAGVTWSDVPKTDGRRLLIGWMSNWEYANKVPTVAWRNATTLPRELVLQNTAVGYRLASKPVKELETLRAKSFELPATEVAGSLDLTDKLGFSPAQSEWVLEFDVPAASAAGAVGIELSNAKGETYRIGYDVAKNQFFSDRTKSGDISFSDKYAATVHNAPRFSAEKTLRLHLYFDVASAELFADDGSTVMTELYFPSEVFSRASVFAEGGKVRLTKASAWQLNRIWK